MHPIITRARNENRVFLTEIEAKELLGQSGIEINHTVLAVSGAEAASVSREMGFPVVLKIASPDILHKQDSGGVALGLQNEAEVARAYDRIISGAKRNSPSAQISGVSVQKMLPPGAEVIIGMHKDAQFGPVLLFGLGGIWVEVLEDTALRVIPVTRRDTEAMIKEIRGYKLLTGYRGQPPVDTARLAEYLLKVAGFAGSYPEIKELDLNPVLAYPDGAVAVDARVILEEV